MTVQPQQPTQAQPLPEQTPQEINVVTAIVALLAIGVSVQALTPKIATLLKPLGISLTAVEVALRIAMSAPVQPRSAKGLDSAEGQTLATEATYRATYIVESARRIQQGLNQKTPIRQIIQQERVWFEKHREAQNRRLSAAQQVDLAGRKYGRLVGWYARRDSRTTQECLMAHGRNFYIDERPRIGYPGTVHPNCRCVAGPPHRNGKRLPSRKVA